MRTLCAIAGLAAGAVLLHAQPAPALAAAGVRCVAFGDKIAAAGRAHNVDPMFLASIAAQETGGPNADDGRNVIGDSGHGHGLFQIDDRYHGDFTGTPQAMDPTANSGYAAGLLRQFLAKYLGDLHKAASAYNSGLPSRCGTRTYWPSFGLTLCYAHSVFRHFERLENQGITIDCSNP